MQDQIINKTIHINAPVSDVWEVLTSHELIKKWISDIETDIITGWTIGNPIIIKGDLHGIGYENKGVVLQFEPGKVLQYSHLSSLSGLSDKPENYCYLEFRLTATENQTLLTLLICNFPTETIRKHLDFYWGTTLELIKRLIEK